MQDIYLLSNQTHKDTISLGVISINYFDISIDYNKYDSVIFTSKNAVYALDRLDKRWKNLQSYSIGEGTSKVIKELRGNLFYEAKDSYGDKFAKELSLMLQAKSVIFPHAKEVVSDVYNILKHHNISVEDAVVYETICKTYKTDQNFKKNSIFIFTSPSTVRCFFKNFTWDDSYKAIAIGQKTAEHLPESIKFYISPKQNIKECVTFAKRLSKSNI